MFGIPPLLAYLLATWILVTAILAILLIYGKIVSTEQNRFNVKRLESEEAAKEEKTIGEKMERLKRGIIPLAVLSGVLLLVTTAVWIWMGLMT
ncbi:MAG: hypothetical protein ACRD4Y_07010 [Candidatus Acidiferrales bacterium]